MKEKIFLLNPPFHTGCIRDLVCSFSVKADYYWPPPDLLILSAILKEKYDLDILDAIAGNITYEACLEKILKSTASTIIFSTGTVSLEEDLRFIERVKKQKNIKVIASSSIFRFIGGEILGKNQFLDAVLPDFNNSDILAYLSSGNSDREYFLHRNVADIKVDFKTEAAEEFSVGIPLQEHFISRNRIPMFGNSCFAIVVASCGCNFKCKFCTAGKFKLKKRNLGEVIEEIKYILNLGISRIFFVDPLFTAEKKRVFEFCNNLKDNRLDIEWVCNAHAASILDKTMLKTMKEAGCKVLMIGVESANNCILKEYNKGIDAQRIKEAFSLCKEAGIKTLAYFIIGLPGEDKKSIKRTIKFAREIKCDYASFGYATPDVGTELRRCAIEKGWIAGPQYTFDSSSRPALITGLLSEKEQVEMLRHAYRDFYLRPGYFLNRLSEAKSPSDVISLFKGGLSLLKKNIL